MPLIAIKLFNETDKTDLDAAVAAYKGAAGAELLTSQRGMSMHALKDPNSNDSQLSLALAHGGIAIPAAAGKTADLQHVYVEEDKIVDAQAALDLALANAVHVTVTDANLDLVANEISSISTPFTTGGEDDGRLVEIAGEVRTIVSVTSTTVAVYDGVALTGTNQTVKLLGAEVLQDVNMNVYKEPDGDYRFMVMAALEGEASD